MTFYCTSVQSPQPTQVNSCISIIKGPKTILQKYYLKRAQRKPPKSPFGSAGPVNMEYTDVVCARFTVCVFFERCLFGLRIFLFMIRRQLIRKLFDIRILIQKEQQERWLERVEGLWRSANGADDETKRGHRRRWLHREFRKLVASVKHVGPAAFIRCSSCTSRYRRRRRARRRSTRRRRRT